MELQAKTTEMENGRKRLIGFYIAAGLFILLFGGMLLFVAPVMLYAITGWFAYAELGAHQIHDTLGAILLWAALLGVVAQLINAQKQVGGMQQALAVLIGLNGAMLLGNFPFPPMLIFLALAIITAVLHPAGRDLLPRFNNISLPLLGSALLTAVPLILFAASQIRLQLLNVPNDEHAEIGHWVIMGGYAITILLLSLLASLRPSGWRLPTWSTGILAILFGLASLVLHGASALSPFWGVVAILWGISFIILAEKTARQPVALD